jgi:hypothetical protein
MVHTIRTVSLIVWWVVRGTPRTPQRRRIVMRSSLRLLHGGLEQRPWQGTYHSSLHRPKIGVAPAVIG